MQKAAEENLELEPPTDLNLNFEYASENISPEACMQQLIAWGIISAEMASFLNYNPSAVTLRGTYNGGAAAPPPLQLKMCAQGWKLASSDSDIINQTIVNESSAPFTALVHSETAEIRLIQSHLGGLCVLCDSMNSYFLL